jgi:hypothetical protein
MEEQDAQIQIKLEQIPADAGTALCMHSWELQKWFAIMC